MITIIAAASTNNALGKKNALLWHLPSDFKRFKQITLDHYIIMGRKTFESLPKLLPNRTHIIITRQKEYHQEGCMVVSSLENALKIAKKEETVFVIGGGEIYRQAIEIADKIELTRVDGFFEADTFFPEIDLDKWDLVFEEFHKKDEKHLYDFSFQTYIAKKIR